MDECELAREVRDVSGFSSVELSGTGVLTVALGDEESLEIEADPRIMDRITSDVDAGTLRLGLTKGSWLRSLKCDGIVFKATMKEVRSLSLSGAGTIEADGLTAGSLDLLLSGNGRLIARGLSVEEVRVKLSGQGECELAGDCGSQELTLSGVGKHLARELKSRTAKITISGAGDAVVDVSETLDVTISGVGNVECHGEATVFRRVTGSGSVTCAADG